MRKIETLRSPAWPGSSKADKSSLPLRQAAGNALAVQFTIRDAEPSPFFVFKKTYLYLFVPAPPAS